MQVALYGSTTSEPSLAQSLILGYAEIEWYGGYVPTVAIRRAGALQFYIRAKNTFLVILAYVSNIIITHSPPQTRGILASAVGAFLSLSLWQFITLLIGVQTLKLVQAIGASTEKEQQLQRMRESELIQRARISNAVDFVERIRRSGQFADDESVESQIERKFTSMRRLQD